MSRHHALSAIGRVESTGLNREAFSDADIQARKTVLSWASRRGYEVAGDAIGNLFVMRPGVGGDAPVVTGSHIDSQPKGGAYDGQFGVLAALETLEALDDASIQTARPVWAVVWANEEG